MEEKRIKLEAELQDKRRKEEREHELQMQRMFFNCMQTLTHTMLHPPNPYYGQPSQHTSTPPPSSNSTPPPSTAIHSPSPSTPHSYNYSPTQHAMHPNTLDFYTHP